MYILTVTPPENVNQIIPSCIPWPRDFCDAQESISPTTVHQSVTVFSTTTLTKSSSIFTTSITTSTVSLEESSTTKFTTTTATSSASDTSRTGVLVTSDPQQPDQQSSASSSSVSSEGIIYSLIASVIALALFIVILATFLTLRFHRRCQYSKTPLQNDSRQRSKESQFINLILSLFTT